MLVDTRLTADQAASIGKDFNDSLAPSLEAVNISSLPSQARARNTAIGSSLAEMSSRIQGTDVSEQELKKVAAGCENVVYQVAPVTAYPGWFDRLYTGSLGDRNSGPKSLEKWYLEGRSEGQPSVQHRNN
jgi:hypothetical protein